MDDLLLINKEIVYKRATFRLRQSDLLKLFHSMSSFYQPTNLQMRIAFKKSRSVVGFLRAILCRKRQKVGGNQALRILDYHSSYPSN
jgi:hypothetical protein